MSLKNQFESKLKNLQVKLDKAMEAFKYTTELVSYEIRRLNKSDPRSNIFAKYSFTLENTLENINNLHAELNIFNQHRDIIVIKDSRIEKALELLDKNEEKISSVITSLQAIAIFLENLKLED